MSNKLFWIDEDYFHLSGILRPLIKLGYEIEVSESFEEAKDRLDKEIDFSLILLDLILPNSLIFMRSQKKEANYLQPWQLGKDLFYYIRNEKRYNGPILLLTIVTHVKVIDELLAVGPTYYLGKSGLLPQDLKEMVINILNK